ncbi:hypothetical protein RB653_009963 [Dictyostelium firmibasis]|uniref:Zinc/iron permease n=1 Tax=Dictyostelium firmibasis TaxID=79012 RepID=A0AAN7TYI1_9MYCE
MSLTPPTFSTVELCQTAFNNLFSLYYSDSDHDHSDEGTGGHEGHIHAGVTCEDDPDKQYSKPIHIAAVFIILGVSVLGTTIPILATHIKQLRIPRYAIIVGKSIGIGVVLSCAFIHMLLPAVISLTSECLPESWHEGYEAYPYLFALLAGIVMQFIDFVVLQYLTNKEMKKAETSKDSISLHDVHTPGGDETSKSHCHTPNGAHGSHVHGGLLMDPAALKTIEAYLLEFGITVHSVFIGLAVGVVDDSTLKALLVALAFHQFFEGVALGSRISDAKLTSHWHEALLASIFSVSAPIGIAIGVGVASSLNVNGPTYLIIQGVFDSVCAGILLYIGFSLMIKDFPEDMEELCRGKKYEYFLRAGLFIGLWVGAAMMAFIGKYL